MNLFRKLRAIWHKHLARRAAARMKRDREASAVVYAKIIRQYIAAERDNDSDVE